MCTYFESPIAHPRDKANANPIQTAAKIHIVAISARYAGNNAESDQWLHADARRCHSHCAGAPGRNRTADLRFTKPLLYQLSYKGTALRLAYLLRQ